MMPSANDGYIDGRSLAALLPCFSSLSRRRSDDSNGVPTLGIAGGFLFPDVGATWRNVGWWQKSLGISHTPTCAATISRAIAFIRAASPLRIPRSPASDTATRFSDRAQIELAQPALCTDAPNASPTLTVTRRLKRCSKGTFATRNLVCKVLQSKFSTCRVIHKARTAPLHQSR